MVARKILITLIILSASAGQVLKGEIIDSLSFRLSTRFSFYSFEKDGEFILKVPSEFAHSTISVSIALGESLVASWKGIPGAPLARIPFQIDLRPSLYRITAKISVLPATKIRYTASTILTVLPYKPNEVKTDRLTGGLMVNRRQFFPFGFYCYSPVPPALPEEEIVRGFNMISPYQTILPGTLGERQAYMDRCAQIGMKVHYNLLSVSGGGGVDSKIQGMSQSEKINRLTSEIRNFMNHPALLAWYISDEPNGYKIPPDSLEEIYRIVKETDPWHPVSMVFMAPFLASKKYEDAMDIVMADPYPVPNHPVGLVGDVTKQLESAFTGERPVWMVLQAFGGGEWWEREPTLQEIRTMTWQSIVNGARGIQYFVRQGLNYFPKSVSAWNECGRLAMEIAELTPWLLSDEEAIRVESSTGNVLVSSMVHDGQLLIVAVNKINAPFPVSFRIKGLDKGTARLIFENRSLSVSGGSIFDYLPPFGSQAYMIDIRSRKKETEGYYENLLKDPGFENSASPGVPSACYARPGGDNGATYFLDTREHHEGTHSLRLTTPAGNKGITIRFFPVSVKAGASYAVSVWAKCDPEQRLPDVTKSDNDRLIYNGTEKQHVEVGMGAFGKARFSPDGDWRRYMTFFSIPEDTVSNFRTNLIISMPGQGVAWIDDLKLYEEAGSGQEVAGRKK